MDRGSHGRNFSRTLLVESQGRRCVTRCYAYKCSCCILDDRSFVYLDRSQRTAVRFPSLDSTTFRVGLGTRVLSAVRRFVETNILLP